MLDYRITSLSGRDAALARQPATHVISLLDPDMACPSLPAGCSAHHLALHLHDLNRTGLPGDPSDRHVQALIALARSFGDGDQPLFHCFAGQSRSAAAAMICDLALRLARGAAPDQDLIGLCYGTLLARRPQASPNLALLRLADKPLGLSGLLASFRPSRLLDLEFDTDLGTDLGADLNP